MYQTLNALHIILGNQSFKYQTFIWDSTHLLTNQMHTSVDCGYTFL